LFQIVGVKFLFLVLFCEIDTSCFFSSIFNCFFLLRKPSQFLSHFNYSLLLNILNILVCLVGFFSITWNHTNFKWRPNFYKFRNSWWHSRRNRSVSLFFLLFLPIQTLAVKLCFNCISKMKPLLPEQEIRKQKKNSFFDSFAFMSLSPSFFFLFFSKSCQVMLSKWIFVNKKKLFVVSWVSSTSTVTASGDSSGGKVLFFL
jgi:hypothetical protein